MRTQGISRFQLFLGGHPRIANRLLGFLGPKYLARIGQRMALRAARRAFDSVPFYRSFWEARGFTSDRFNHLTIDDFARLPHTNKQLTEDTPDTDLLYSLADLAADVAMIGQSSGTRRKPTRWPIGWSEFLSTSVAFLPILRNLALPQGARTAIVLAAALEGGDASGNMLYRVFFALKERTGWNVEIVVPGEQSETMHDWLLWLSHHGFTSLMFISFPGTLERFLDYELSLQVEQRIDWDLFTRKHISLGGQLVDRALRQRFRDEMRLDPNSLTGESILYASSDTGQLIAHSTPFTLWLEGYLEQHPELGQALGLTDDCIDKPILELMPPVTMYYENDDDEGVLLTTWKLRPLIRYAIGDRLWLPDRSNILPILKKVAPSWRRDFAKVGGRRSDVSRSTRIGVVLGRADDIVIVNGANITPSMVWHALELADLNTQVRHIKHQSNPARPNVYELFLELTTLSDKATLEQMERDWQPRLLQALLNVPAATDLVAAHRTNPVTFILHIRARGEQEFQADGSRKTTYTLPTQQSADSTSSHDRETSTAST